jgi:hypothetical protein
MLTEAFPAVNNPLGTLFEKGVIWVLWGKTD